MADSLNQIRDDEFLRQFENLTLDKGYFNHIGHLRLAWLYLSRGDVEYAVQRVCCGIKAYAESLGAMRKFHLTITDAVVRIMAKRFETYAATSWRSFLDRNPDLVEDLPGVLGEYFSRPLLSSEAARLSVCPPDLKPL